MRALTGLALLSLLAPSHLGSGDSVQPRDTEAVIDSVVPSPPAGVRIDVVGADTFIRVRSTGHEVLVPGYEDEPYMRIGRDGRVEVNDGSVTAVMNGDRYGNVDVSQFSPSSTPRWRIVADDGVAMWHDHRSHWMSPKPPATIDDEGTVQTFEIPITVDGVETKVKGTLFLRDGAGDGWWFAGMVGLVAALALALRRRPLWTLLVAVSGIALVVGVLEWVGLPRGARITPVLALFAAMALLSSVVAAMMHRTGRTHLTPVMNAGAAAAMLTSVWMCSDQVTSAYVPGLDSSVMWTARLVIPTMLGVALVALIDGVMRVVKRPA